MDHRGMSKEAMPNSGADVEETSPAKRGDLFSDDAPGAETSTEPIPFYKTEQFVWTLKWTHIHLFGMNMIFIFMGVIAIFLDVSTRRKTLLVVSPFAGVLIDIATMWLKAFVSPAFFWLHIPGGAKITQADRVRTTICAKFSRLLENSGVNSNAKCNG
jgi:hypothetical protein